MLLTALLLKDCGEGDSISSHTDTIRTETIYRYDTVIHTIQTHNIHYRDTIVMEAVTDTSQLIQDYFTRHDFTDSLSDTNIAVTYSATLWKNSLFNPSFSYKLLKPQTIITNTVLSSSPKAKIFLGGFACYRDEPSVGLLMTYQGKRENLLTVGYGTGPTYLVGYQFKIRLK